MKAGTGVRLYGAFLVAALVGWGLYSFSSQLVSIFVQEPGPRSNHEKDVVEFLAEKHSVTVQSPSDIVFGNYLTARDSGEFSCSQHPSYQAAFNAFSRHFKSTITRQLQADLFALYENDSRKQFIDIGSHRGRILSHGMIKDQDVEWVSPLTVTFNWDPFEGKQEEHDAARVVYDIVYNRGFEVFLNKADTRIEGMSMNQLKEAFTTRSENSAPMMSECAAAAMSIFADHF